MSLVDTQTQKMDTELDNWFLLEILRYLSWKWNIIVSSVHIITASGDQLGKPKKKNFSGLGWDGPYQD